MSEFEKAITIAITLMLVGLVTSMCFIVAFSAKEKAADKTEDYSMQMENATLTDLYCLQTADSEKIPVATVYTTIKKYEIGNNFETGTIKVTGTICGIPITNNDDLLKCLSKKTEVTVSEDSGTIEVFNND